MMPGATALTRMPREAYSTASDLVTAARPPFVSAASAVGSTESARSATLALILTTWPLRCFSISPIRLSHGYSWHESHLAVSSEQSRPALASRRRGPAGRTTTVPSAPHPPASGRADRFPRPRHGDGVSDWDFTVTTAEFEAVRDALPSLTAPLRPVVAQWDRLSRHWCYMMILAGRYGWPKIDLIFGQPYPITTPWLVSAATLTPIDDHFWDWALWLGSKQLAGPGRRRDR
jgi:hypothetical protein